MTPKPCLAHERSFAYGQRLATALIEPLYAFSGRSCYPISIVVHEPFVQTIALPSREGPHCSCSAELAGLEREPLLIFGQP